MDNIWIFVQSKYNKIPLIASTVALRFFLTGTMLVARPSTSAWKVTGSPTCRISRLHDSPIIPNSYDAPLSVWMRPVHYVIINLICYYVKPPLCILIKIYMFFFPLQIKFVTFIWEGRHCNVLLKFTHYKQCKKYKLWRHDAHTYSSKLILHSYYQSYYLNT